jgi:hypothetical protein
MRQGRCCVRLSGVLAVRWAGRCRAQRDWPGISSGATRLPGPGGYHFPGVGAAQTSPDPTGYASGGDPAPTTPTCEGAVQYCLNSPSSMAAPLHEEHITMRSCAPSCLICVRLAMQSAWPLSRAKSAF